MLAGSRQTWPIRRPSFYQLIIAAPLLCLSNYAGSRPIILA
jgi:hypothetical protein